MRIVTSTEVARTSINHAIQHLKDELEIHQNSSKLWREMPSVITVEAHITHCIKVLEAIKIEEFGNNKEARDILFAMGYMPLCQCDECGASHRTRFFEFGSDSQIFRVCFVCMLEASDTINEHNQIQAN